MGRKKSNFENCYWKIDEEALREIFYSLQSRRLLPEVNDNVKIKEVKISDSSLGNVFIQADNKIDCLTIIMGKELANDKIWFKVISESKRVYISFPVFGVGTEEATLIVGVRSSVAFWERIV